MDTRIAKENAMIWVRQNSGLEDHRTYLGMSQIGRCSRLLYEWMFNGKNHMSDRAHLNCISGYMYERKVLEILMGARIIDVMANSGMVGHEIVAPFDARFRGHIDAVAADGSLLEIKSLNADNYDRVTRANQIPREYLWQVNAYMRYGNFGETLFVAVCRDPFTFWMFNLKRDDMLGRQIEEKAKRILAAIDAQTPPECECGRCVGTK